jgi:hypothetical protein
MRIFQIFQSKMLLNIAMKAIITRIYIEIMNQ